MENLGIDYKLLIAQIVNFGLLFYIFNKLVAKPFLKYLQEEKKKDIDRDVIAAELMTKKERMLEEEQAWRKKLKAEQEKLLQAAKKIAEEKKAAILEDAKSEAASIISKAHEQVEEEKSRFYREVKKHISDVSVAMIEGALRKYLTSDIQKKLTEYVLSSVKSNKNKYD